MPENQQKNNKSLNPDWFVQGVLTKIGDTFDRLTGRGWKPSSNLATSELIEKLKTFLDQESIEDEDLRRFVPHNIKLKMQWDKFSTDSTESLRKLENEMLIAAVDHINDKRYFTYAPLNVEAKPDYFTSGIKLQVSFDSYTEENQEAELSLPTGKTDHNIQIPENILNEEHQVTLTFEFVQQSKVVTKSIDLKNNSRISIGRTKENHLAIDDISISKFHASITLDKDNKLLLADTGSTNGTFIRGSKIAYGKAIHFEPEEQIKFGNVNVTIKVIHTNIETKQVESSDLPESYVVGDIKFSSGKTPSADNNPANPSAEIQNKKQESQ